MTTSKRQIPIDDHKPKAAEVPEAATRDVDQASATAAGPEYEALAGERETLLRERDTLADSLLRARAEFENYRKRASRELAAARERAQGEILGDLLPVLDNLERALDAAEHHQEGKVLDGVRLTRNQFVDLLTRIGVQEIEGLGAAFDPAVHDAILVQPSEYDEGLVAAVLERGYRQGDRVLRAARVIVSAGRAGAEAGSAAG
jgi:molecular chaperone GrpE